MRTHKDVSTGDAVLVFDTNGVRKNWPEDGEPGEVVKAGPKLVSVRHARAYGLDDHVQVFRRETGRANDRYGHQSYSTPEEHAARKRREDLQAELRSLGLSIEWHRTDISTGTLEKLAQVMRDAQGGDRP
jgi:hypothetical protein